MRFNLQPLGPQEPPVSRRDEATREMRRLVGPIFGDAALHWFDQRSEEWRGMGGVHGFTTAPSSAARIDRDGLAGSKVYYEINARPDRRAARDALVAGAVGDGSLPGLFPLFTSITCRRDTGTQRSTFVHRGPLRLAICSR